MDAASRDLTDRIVARGLPEVVARIAVDGGEAVHPALWFRAKPVWRATSEAVMGSTSEALVPLWASGTAHAFAGQGRFVIWDAESSEPDEVFDSFTELVRNLLTDLYEDEEDEAEISHIAHLLLPADEAAAALELEER